jgi:polysaccharide biosynthesis protein PslG
MRARIRASLAILAGSALLGLLLSSPAPASRAAAADAARASSSVPLMGVTIPDADTSATSRAVAAARALHATVVRIDAPWFELEPLGANRLEPHALAQLDAAVHDAAAANLKVIMLVEGTPCWSSSAPASLLRRCASGRQTAANAWPPREPADYAAFVAYLAARYGTSLAAIEVWSEPDQANELYFAGPDKPQRYAALLRAAYPAIKAVNPQVQVLAGALVGSNGAFLRALYAAGIKGYYNGLSVHFYNLVLASLRSIHEVQIANGDTTPLWLDEFGWSSCYPKHKIQEELACVTATTQGADLADIVRSLAHTPYIAAEVVYELQSSGAQDFGLLSAAGARKPAFRALSRAFASPFASPPRVTLSLSARRGRTVASGSAPVGDFIGLEAFQGSVLRYKAVFTLNRFNRYSIALPAVLGTSGLRVRVYRYWSGLAAAAQRSN